MTLSYPIRRFTGESNKPASCRCVGLSNDGVSPILETEITMFTYGMAVNGAGSTFERSRKLIQPSKLPGAVYYLECVCLNQQVATNFDIGLVAPDSSIAAILSMAPTGAGSGIGSLTRYRSTSSFTLSQDGVYQHHLYTTTNQGIPYSLKLIPVQTNGRSTVIHFPMMVGQDPRYADGGGIAGGDLFRTTSQTYVEGDSFSGGNSVDIRFPFFYYVASEWIGIQEVILEVLSQGFAASQHCALFNNATGDMVVGAEVINPTGGWLSGYTSFSASALTDGLYVLKCKSGTPATNSFFYGAWLHLVVGGVDPDIKGNVYYKVGTGQPGYYRSKPPAAASAYLEACYRGHPTLPTTWTIDGGILDVGAGSKIAATEFAINTNNDAKHLTRNTTSIEPYLTAGNRFYSENLSGLESQSFIIKPFRC